MKLEQEQAFKEKCKNNLPNYIKVNDKIYRMSAYGLMSGGYRIGYGNLIDKIYDEVEFDFIIEDVKNRLSLISYEIIKENKPKEGMEYIYLLDMVWKPNTGCDSYPIKYGTIVKDVKLVNGYFEFIEVETNNIYSTNYGWALAENTPENVDRINKYLECDEKLKELEKSTKLLRNEVIDLNDDIIAE